jgi:hypothetical protein
MNHRIVATLLPLLLLATPACGNPTRIDAKSAHDLGHGTRRVLDGSMDQLWLATHAAVSWNEIGAAKDNEAEHSFTTDPARFDQVGVWLEPEGPSRTRVTVVVIDDPNLPGPNEEGVMNDVVTALKLVSSGSPTSKRP